MTLRAASLGPSARLARAPLGGLRPPAASLRCAGSRRPPWGAAPRGPGPLPGPTRAARLGALRCPRHKWCARWARWALFRPACGPPLRRGPFPRAGPAAACAPAPASRLRSGRFGPRFARRRRARGVPPGSPARGRAASFLRPSRPARWPRLPSAPAALRCGLPIRSPLLRLALGLVQRVAPPGPPFPRPSGFGPGPLPPGGCAGLSPGFSAPAPGRWLRGRPGGLAALLSGVFRWGGVLPCAPPPRRPRWGLRGA